MDSLCTVNLSKQRDILICCMHSSKIALLKHSLCSANCAEQCKHQGAQILQVMLLVGNMAPEEFQVIGGTCLYPALILPCIVNEVTLNITSQRDLLQDSGGLFLISLRYDLCILASTFYKNAQYLNWSNYYNKSSSTGWVVCVFVIHQIILFYLLCSYVAMCLCSIKEKDSHVTKRLDSFS